MKYFAVELGNLVLLRLTLAKSARNPISRIAFDFWIQVSNKLSNCRILLSEVTNASTRFTLPSSFSIALKMYQMFTKWFSNGSGIAKGNTSKVLKNRVDFHREQSLHIFEFLNIAHMWTAGTQKSTSFTIASFRRCMCFMICSYLFSPISFLCFP